MRRKFTKLLSLTLAVALCPSMAEPAFAFGGLFGGSGRNRAWNWR